MPKKETSSRQAEEVSHEHPALSPVLKAPLHGCPAHAYGKGDPGLSAYESASSMCSTYRSTVGISGLFRGSSSIVVGSKKATSGKPRSSTMSLKLILNSTNIELL